VSTGNGRGPYIHATTPWTRGRGPVLPDLASLFTPFFESREMFLARFTAILVQDIRNWSWCSFFHIHHDTTVPDMLVSNMVGGRIIIIAQREERELLVSNNTDAIHLSEKATALLPNTNGWPSLSHQPVQRAAPRATSSWL
jgi:hypothetical protein